MVNIITPTYRRHTQLVNCLSSIYGNTADFRLLVCSDGYDETVENIVDTCPEGNYSFTENSHNWGCTQRNYALGKVGSRKPEAGSQNSPDWILYLDDDNTLMPGILDRLCSEIEPETGIIFGKVEHEWAGLIWKQKAVLPNEIDTLNMFVRSDIAVRHRWDGSVYEHDYRYIRKCLATAQEMNCGVKWIDDVIGIHGGANKK